MSSCDRLDKYISQKLKADYGEWLKINWEMSPAVSYTHLDVYKRQIHDSEFLKERMKVHELSPEDPGLKDYCDAFTYGCPPHAGGGIGLERVVMFYLDLKNIRRASLFPRDPKRLRP